VCIALCTIVAHNIAQNRPDNFPSYSPDNHHCSDDVYLRERGHYRDETTVRNVGNVTYNEGNAIPQRSQNIALYFTV